SEPLEHVSPTAPVIVVSNAGATHHVGPGRLYVKLARTLSRAGFRCFRLDQPGLGDSILPDTAAENDSYPTCSTDVIALAIDALTRLRSATAFAVMGLCSGAHTAFH